MSARDLFTGIEGEAPDVAVIEPESPTEEAGEQAMKPITAAQWKKILGWRCFKILVKDVQQEWAGSSSVQCHNCKHAGRAAGGHDPWRAYCLVNRVMVSNAFPKLCPAYETA